MNNQVIGEIVRAYVVARRKPEALDAKAAAGMFVTQYGAQEAFETIDKINAGATEGFWYDVLYYLKKSLGPSPTAGT